MVCLISLLLAIQPSTSHAWVWFVAKRIFLDKVAKEKVKQSVKRPYTKPMNVRDKKIIRDKDRRMKNW